MSGNNLTMPAGGEVNIDKKVAFLREPGHYPAGAGRVEVIETHMSWVFLTEDRVYKLKKPVRYEFLDFSTLESRRLDSEREVILNRRLAGDTYLRTLPLTLEKNGELRLDGDGEPVDWLVEMRRLPQDRTLEALILNRTVEPQDIDTISGLLNGFYAQQTPLLLSGKEYRALFAGEIEENHEVLSRPAYGLPVELVQRLTSLQRSFLSSDTSLLEERVVGGRVIEGHGDLRPEHVFLTTPPVIIDCLEFNRNFRIIDPADELSYLGLECERLGADWIGERLLQNYTKVSGDRCPGALIDFYRLFRACLRAKIAVWHVEDHQINNAEKWLRRAKDYMVVAKRHLPAEPPA
ncbi:MAG: hypothetical protein P8126_02360 [Gammaproteobacteria bacterium]